ncbi:MAG: hypothetical protein IPM95_05635 [Sphingobacteriales bacterium]|nr:hypothetical protein [Sphingobacteriales bacterium]
MKSILSVLVWFCFILHAKGQNVFGFTYYTNEEDSVIVTGVLKNSPADKAELKVGDFLNFINDIPLSFKKKELLTKVLSEAPATNNELRFFRAPEVKKTIIHKAPLSSFEFTCISGNCINGECIVESAFGYTIKGRCTDNTISGAAECYNTDGTLYYKGNMLKNKFEGNGIQYTANKIKFEGAFKNGLRQGNGKITYPDNSYLTGFWKEDKIEGNAQFFNANTKQTSNRIYKNGKMEQETKTDVLAENNTAAKPTSTETIKTEIKNVKKNPATTLKILEAKSGYMWSTNFFSEKYPNTIPKKQKPPFEKTDYKALASAASLTPETLKLVVEQCAYENWPSFYKSYTDINTLFKFAFRNLMFEKVLTFRADKDNGEYKSYGQYTIIFIRNDDNKHAPKEMLSDDGIGFFMCVDAEILQDFMNPVYNYTAFTIDKPFKGGGFGNWQSKKAAYIQDMKSIEDQYYNLGFAITDKELQTSLGLSAAEFKKLKDLCAVQYRPDGLKTEQQIIDAQRNAVFVDMKVYQLANLGGTHLIYVPKNENYHLAQDMQPKSSEGWYFCTKSNVDINKPDASYISSIKATTDANMEKYRIEQAAREETMKQDAYAKALWAEKNKFKGVIIYQFEEWDDFQKKQDYSYKVVSIFGPPNQSLLKEDKIKIDKIVGADITKEIAAPFKPGMDEAQAIEYVNSKTNSHRFSVNTNFSYTIPERNSISNADELKKTDAELAKNQQERDKLYKEMMESNTSEKMEQSMKAMTDILSAPKKEIPRNTSLEVISIDTSDKNYTQLKKYIGKQGTAKTSLKINSEGTYSGMIEFTFDFNVINFEKVNVKIVP